MTRMNKFEAVLLVITILYDIGENIASHLSNIGTDKSAS